MVDSTCKEFTVLSWWTLIEGLAGQLHRQLSQLRRRRGVFIENASLCLFHGRAPGLECVGWSHHNPRARPRAWVSVDVRSGDPIGRSSIHGRSTWAREISLEARLPEAHARKLVQDTVWWCAPKDIPLPGAMDEEMHLPHDREWRRVRIAPQKLHVTLRDEEQRRLRDNEQRSPGEWRPPLIPPRVWIDPGRTRREVTTMALLLTLWQEGMVRFEPEDAPDAWAFVKRLMGSTDDAGCWEILAALRRNFVASEDWRGLPMYLKKLKRRESAHCGDAQHYDWPLRDVLDGAMPAEVS